MRPNLKKEIDETDVRIKAILTKEAKRLVREEKGVKLQIKILRQHFRDYKYHVNYDLYQTIMGLKDTTLYNAVLEIAGFMPYYNPKKLRMMIKPKRKK